MGGAIYNEGVISSIAGNFENNTSVLGGGAIMNYGEVRSLEGSFLNNSTQVRGGAIYNGFNGVINIKANNDDVIFRGNSDSTGSNAIYNEAVVNMNPINHNIIFDDKIDGYSTQSSTININSDSQDSKVVFNNEVSNNTVNLRHGVLEFGKSEFDGVENFGNFSNSVNFNYYDGTISLQNGNIQNTNLGNLELFSDMDLKLEGDFENLKLDTFTLDSFKSNDHKINISNILLLSPTTLKSFSLSPIGSISDSELFNSLKNSIEYSGGDVVYSPIFKYITTYDPNTGMLNFIQPEYDNFNPAILLSPIAAQIGGYLHLSRSYQEAFRNMDMYYLLEKNQRLNLKYPSRYASEVLTGGVKGYYNKRHVWFRPYSIFENVPLKNAFRVNNKAYGAFFGAEFEPVKLRRKFNFIFAPYFSYNGSHQTFKQTNGIYQNGGLAGIVGYIYKNNFFMGLTALSGANGCQGNTMYGSEDFSMFLAGAAMKAGYNFDIKEKAIIQPNFLISYSFVQTFDYKTASNVDIKTHPLNAVQIAPGVKFIGNFKNNFQPYICVNMFWNILDKTKFRANDVALPYLSIKPFVLYGAGFRKIIKERFEYYFQALVANGGINGVGLYAGLRYEL